MVGRQRIEMLEHRAPAVERLQEEEARERLRSAVGRFDRAQRQLVGALLGPAENVGEAALEAHAGADVERGRNVAIIEHQLLVGEFAHAHEADADATIGLVTRHAEAQVGPANLDRLAHALAGKGVGAILFLDEEAHVRRRRLRFLIFDGADLLGRQRQRDDGVACVGGHVDGRGSGNCSGIAKAVPSGITPEQRTMPNLPSAARFSSTTSSVRPQG